MLMNMSELQCDKTFKRTRCREFEINGFDSDSQRLLTLARVFFDGESDEAYFRAFTLVFDRAEKDTGMPVPFGHIFTDQTSRSGSRIKAILVDMHGGQINGLSKYFKSKYSADEDDFHILRIVKTCRVHFYRSINQLPKGQDDQYERTF
jgi:hypothetical protein